VVTIGNFDGVHLGHQALLQRTLTLAAELGVSAAAFTFYPAPRDVLRPDNPVIRIQRVQDRIAALLAAGLDQVILEPFTLDYAKRDAQWFAEEVLTRRLNASAVVVGWDFRFGRDRAGGVDELKRWMDVPVLQIAPFETAGETVSSSRIRFALHEGDVEQAAGLLGHTHEVVGCVVKGDGRGTALGFPTANLDADTPLIPGDGVYAVTVLGVGEEALSGVCNIGCRPTFGSGARQIEVHLLDFDGDLYGQTLRLCFVKRLRGERRFDAIDALKTQISTDIASASTVLAAEW